MSCTRKTTTTTATCVAALIGAGLVIAAPTPARASPPTRFEICLAILTEPICDLVRSPEHDSKGSGGTKPAVVNDVLEGVGTVDISCGGTSIANHIVCAG